MEDCCGGKKEINEEAKMDAEVLAGFLKTALDLEDRVSSDVYEDFLIRASWPDNLDSDSFEEIRGILMTLIGETEGHKQAFLSLKNKLGYRGIQK